MLNDPAILPRDLRTFPTRTLEQHATERATTPENAHGTDHLFSFAGAATSKTSQAIAVLVGTRKKARLSLRRPQLYLKHSGAELGGFAGLSTGSQAPSCGEIFSSSVGVKILRRPLPHDS